MDGYAVCAEDVATVPARLKLIGEVGGRPTFRRPRPQRRNGAHIFTGGVLPPGADTVVIQENTGREGDNGRCEDAGGARQERSRRRP